MARKTPSRLDKRKEIEAAEARQPGGRADAAKAKPKRKAAAPRKRATREKVPQRKRIVWGVFSGSMKEEARFPYDQRAAAEEKLEQLRAKSKKLYFLQPIKEVIGEAPAPAPRPAEPVEPPIEVEAPEFEGELDEDDIAPEPFEPLPDEEEEDLEEED